MVKLEYEGQGELEDVVKKLMNEAKDIRVWLFYGEMGAGKTTMIKAICDHLEVEDNVSSPTFSLVNEYLTLQGETVYHFDFYRIKNEEEAVDIGIDEYFYSGDYCFLEWPTKITNLLPEHYLKIEIENLTNTKRSIVISRHETA